MSNIQSKIANQKSKIQMVVFRGEEFDAKAAELTIRRGVDGLSRWRFNANSADVYTSCQVTYFDPVKNEMVEYLYVPSEITNTAKEYKEPSIGQVLKVNQRCKSLAEAEELAKASLRKKNMRHVKTTLELMGNVKLYSGMNFLVEDFGRWDSVTWQAEQVTYEYSKSSGLSTTVEARGILGF